MVKWHYATTVHLNIRNKYFVVQEKHRTEQHNCCVSSLLLDQLQNFSVNVVHSIGIEDTLPKLY